MLKIKPMHKATTITVNFKDRSLSGSLVRNNETKTVRMIQIPKPMAIRNLLSRKDVAKKASRYLL